MNHLTELQAAAKDGELWKLWFTTVPHQNDMEQEIHRRLDLYKKGNMLPFSVICQKTNRIIGMTTYMNIDQPNRRVEIGSTWLAKSFQGTAINIECKLLLLTHAFETLECIAVQFYTHRLNIPSRRAIESLGAQLDAVLRNHRIMESGTIRDSCIYSIIQNEWSAIKVHLTYKFQTKLSLKNS